MALTNYTRTELEERLLKLWWWKGATLAATIVAVGISIVAIIFGMWAWQSYNNFNQPTSIYVSQYLPPTPFAFYIESAGSPVLLTLPHDLSAFRGNVYRIYSNTAQPHVVQIDGSTGATFDGGNRVATFGGSIRDGFEFEVTTSNIANVKFVKNVIFS